MTMHAILQPQVDLDLIFFPECITAVLLQQPIPPESTTPLGSTLDPRKPDDGAMFAEVLEAETKKNSPIKQTRRTA